MEEGERKERIKSPLFQTIKAKPHFFFQHSLPFISFPTGSQPATNPHLCSLQFPGFLGFEIQRYYLSQFKQLWNPLKYSWLAPWTLTSNNSSRSVSSSSGSGQCRTNHRFWLIEALPKLEIVASFSVGLDMIDLAKCKEKGIRVTNTPNVLTEDVADLAIGLMLAVLRKLCESDRYVRSGKWKKGDYVFTTKFTGKKVGIIEKPEIKYKYYPSVVELAAHCDILVVACPLIKETRHIINKEFIDMLGPKGVLINIGRDPHVDELELVSALVECRLGGAELDVFEHEPNVPEELFVLDNVVLLPQREVVQWKPVKPWLIL
ncbi:hypothetical protein V6N11_030047 [Hibiscus sabdariffa]|uniref:Uncharacterized protein n=1 Tax=Hibiscus sabdariffa TaxID=183260 RepID=A0ABR2PK31_9ROSI